MSASGSTSLQETDDERSAETTNGNVLFAPGHRRSERDEKVLCWWTVDFKRFAWLQRCVADMMAVPRMRCRRRVCRRRGRCGFVQPEDHSPACLCNLAAAEREAYLDLLRRAMHHYAPHYRISLMRRTELDHVCEELELAVAGPNPDRIGPLRERWREAAEALASAKRG